MSEDVLAPLLERAVRIADAPDVRALVLLGSLARGEGTRWSDVDIERWVEPDAPALGTVPQYVDGRLVAVSTNTIDEVHESLERPEVALWAVPAYRSMRVLLDRKGDAEAVRRQAETFSWDALRPAADRFINVTIAKAAEFVLKIHSATERRDEWAALHASWSLIGRCPRIVTVAGGVFIKTENDFYRVACEAAGPAWTRAFRASFGLESAHDAFAQAAAARELYAKTATLVEDRLSDAARAVVTRTLALATA